MCAEKILNFSRNVAFILFLPLLNTQRMPRPSLDSAKTSKKNAERKTCRAQEHTLPPTHTLDCPEGNMRERGGKAEKAKSQGEHNFHSQVVVVGLFSHARGLSPGWHFHGHKGTEAYTREEFVHKLLNAQTATVRCGSVIQFVSETDSICLGISQ